jgi:hypothetical protein
MQQANENGEIWKGTGGRTGGGVGSFVDHETSFKRRGRASRKDLKNRTARSQCSLVKVVLEPTSRAAGGTRRRDSQSSEGDLGRHLRPRANKE